MGFDKISLKGRALRLLAGREHSRAELEKKLAPHEEEPGELQRALDELQAKGFISDRRVVESVIHRRGARLGASRVKQELQAKGISLDCMADALESLRGTELQRAREVWRKKFGEPAADPAGRARQMRFLASRGFGAEAIRRVVAGNEDD
ncbi:recombination regulator RecX [Hydrogenophaga sp. RWCD_12]|uniref:recombination regulator RecX n=1 Tax=Hydrogenophaga sp. RWCD_12 TaxID=3391190 RepID=UPI003984D2C3